MIEWLGGFPGPDPAWGFSIAGIVVVGAAASAITSIDSRGKYFRENDAEVGLAKVGLAEKSVEIFGEVRQVMDRVLPVDGSTFDPEGVVVDPRTLLRPIRRALRSLRQSRTLRRRFRTVLVLQTGRLVAAALWFASSITAAVLYFTMFETTESWFWASMLSILSFTCWLIATIVSTVLQNLIQFAIESGKAGKN